MGSELLVVPASLAQQSLWVHSRVAANSAAYHVIALVRITGPLQLPALERAVDAIVDRHESLRTVFRIEDDQLMQVIAPSRPAVLEVQPVDIDHVESTVERLLARPFDLASGPLLRLHVLRQSADAHLVVLVMHHIVTDGASSAILLAELTQLYEAERNGTGPGLAELPIQYADFALWHRRRLSGDRLRRLTDHWSSRLTAARPLGDPRPPASDPAPAIQSPFRWPPELSAQVRRLADAYAATPFMVLVAGFAAVLARFHDQTDVTVVSPVEGRGRPELAGVVGYLLNAVLIRVDLSGDPTVATLLERVRASSLDAFDHQELPIEQVSGLLRRHGGPGADRIPSGAMVVLQQPRPSTWHVADLTFELLPTPAAIAKSDVVLDVRPDGGTFTGTLEADPAVRTPSDAAWLTEALPAFLRGACATPDAKVAALARATAPALPALAGRATGRRPQHDSVAVDRERPEFVAPRTPMESAVAGAWRTVLAEGPIGVHDNFFDLGGQSLGAVRIAARLREMFGVEVSVPHDLYPDFTVAAIAARLAGRVAERGEAAATVPPLLAQRREPGELRFRASPAQQGMWAELTPDHPDPLVMSAVRVRGPLDIERLTTAFAAVAARHETLRSTYREVDGELMQVVSPEARMAVTVRDAAPEEYPAIVRAEVDRRFDLEKEFPVRVIVLGFAEDDRAVLLILHHIIGDRRSIDVFARDAWACYLGREDTLPRLPVQFADFAQWHHRLLAGARGDAMIAYWTDRLAGARPATIPGDLTPSGGARPAREALEVPIPPATFDAVTALSADYRVTLNSVGLTAFSTLLARWTGDREICLRAPVSYRDDSQVQNLVADFSNDVVIRLFLDDAPTFADLLRQVDRVTTEGFAQHELPPHLLEPHLPDPSLLNRLFRIQFTTEPEVATEPAVEGLAISGYVPKFPYAYRPLSVRLTHGAEGPKCVWLYQSDRFSPARIERLAADYLDILAELAADPARPLLPVATTVGGSPDYGTGVRP